jgi:GNAT superfamily N-acetyltransferase
MRSALVPMRAMPTRSSRGSARHSPSDTRSRPADAGGAGGFDGGGIYAWDVVVREIPVADTRPLRHRILRPHESIEYLISHEPPDAFAVGAFAVGGRLVAVGFIGRDGEPGAWRVRGMATEPDARGRGAGSAVLAALLDHALRFGSHPSHPPTRVWCNARVPARSLYERAGFTVVSEEFDQPHIGPHLVMEWRAPASRDHETSVTDA